MNFTQFPIDSPLFPEGVERCSLVRFSLWIFFLLLILGAGLLAAFSGPLERIKPDQYE